MRSSAGECRTPPGRGTWVRLAVLALVVAATAVDRVPGATDALLTHTVEVTTVVRVSPGPTPSPTPTTTAPAGLAATPGPTPGTAAPVRE